jgi:hypothetical protein
MEDDLKKIKKMEDDLKKNGRQPQKKWKTNQSTKINLIGCDTIVNSASSAYICSNYVFETKPINPSMRLRNQAGVHAIISLSYLWQSYTVFHLDCQYFKREKKLGLTRKSLADSTQ